MACAVLGVPHSGLSEGIRGLLATEFDSVLLVADEHSLLACLDAVHPELLVLDLALAPRRALGLTARLRSSHPGLRILVLVDDEDPGLASAVAAAGADGCLLTRALGADLLPAAEVVLAGGRAFWSGDGVHGPARGIGSPPPEGEPERGG